MPSTRRRLPDFEFPFAPRVAATRLALPCAPPPSAPTRVPLPHRIMVARMGAVWVGGGWGIGVCEGGGRRDGGPSGDSATTGSGVVTSGAATLIWYGILPAPIEL
ncbi:hypothetical protein GQ55_1G421500 [Panicum hallii var. hallii]|uniref:Uncharacterized protein n=1 Tax=Panicum hallii var. hallii TaxID=1504633 RepID=A0A2T7FD80_9POAL|nr:hypothetical protein GQ55_1G421500 [Panicum hallii var. hallii]